MDYLKQGWSPEQIADRLRPEASFFELFLSAYRSRMIIVIRLEFISSILI